jgi:transcriptional regulator with XRE-family HTH domain
MTQEEAVRGLRARMGEDAPSLSWLSKLERGVYSDPSARAIAELARLYRCDPGVLAAGEDTEQGAA